jgi:hypothetical protein
MSLLGGSFDGRQRGRKAGTRFNLEDRVKIRHSEATSARIVELRGPLGPGDVHIYGNRVVRKVAGTRPIRTYVEVMEDQLELVAAKV